MKCPRCNRELVEQIVPSYLGHIYYCEKCKKDYFFRQVVEVCSICNKHNLSEYKLIDDWSKRIEISCCEDCKKSLTTEQK